MLSVAIAATLAGFALLVVGLITGQVWFAIACIVISLIGVVLLVVDVVRSGRARASDDNALADSDSDYARGAYFDDEATNDSSGTAAYGDATAVGLTEGERGGGPMAYRRPGLFDDETGQQIYPDDEPLAPPPTPRPARNDGSLQDYMRATTGEFSAQPSGGDRTGGGASVPAHDDSDGPAIRPHREPETEPVRRSRHRAADGAVTGGATGMPKFDPLDPNWRPPAP